MKTNRFKHSFLPMRFGIFVKTQEIDSDSFWDFIGDRWQKYPTLFLLGNKITFLNLLNSHTLYHRTSLNKTLVLFRNLSDFFVFLVHIFLCISKNTQIKSASKNTTLASAIGNCARTGSTNTQSKGSMSCPIKSQKVKRRRCCKSGTFCSAGLDYLLLSLVEAVSKPRNPCRPGWKWQVCSCLQTRFSDNFSQKNRALKIVLFCLVDVVAGFARSCTVCFPPLMGMVIRVAALDNRFGFSFLVWENILPFPPF